MTVQSTPPFVAGATISRKKFVKISGDNTVIQCVANDVAIGVSGSGTRDTPIPGGSPEAALAGDPVKVHSLGECVPMAAGAALTAGQFVKPNASGDPIPCSAADKYSGQVISGQATVGADAMIYLCRGVA